MRYEHIKRELFFPVSEFERRLAIIRKAMAERGVEVMLAAGPENIYYASGYQTFGFHNYQLCAIPLEGKPFLILRYLESMLAYRYSWLDDVVTWDDTDDPVAITVQALKERGLDRKSIGVEENAYFFQVGSWKKLNDALPRVVNGSGCIEVARAIKSPTEVAFMREAARLSDLGMTAAITEAQAGRTENDMAAAAFDVMTRGGSEYLTRDPIITSGDRSGLPHSCYYRRTLQEGDAVLLELSGVYHRYYGPLMRGVVIGRPDPRVERMAAVCIEALNAAIDAVRPGATSADVDRVARGIIERAQLWENYRKRTGYSVGIGFSSWVEGAIASLKEDDPTVLRPGMCFHIPVAMRLYGEAGVGFSETVHVTETGVEVLGRHPRQLARK